MLAVMIYMLRKHRIPARNLRLIMLIISRYGMVFPSPSS